MFKNICKAIVGVAMTLFASNANAVDLTFNSIATAYLTTTISQYVVFDSTMQAGGTFTFSVLAHNGGGRAGQSDTANVKMQFYTAANALVTTVNTNYSANLPNPNAVCGNPCIDPAVPWTTLSTSATLTAAQASTIAYVKVSMYGVDGSFWAGDYGPWYRVPTLTLDGGTNLIYNPEFGPYNGITAQGWTTSPAFGACQGAWGGSNACIVDATNTPGHSTAGLVANVNGGGPDPLGGTTNGTPGGYNSAITATAAATSNGSGGSGGGGGGGGPSPVTNASGTTGNNPSGTTVTTVDNSGTYTNDGTTGAVTNNSGGTYTNNGTGGDVTNSGTFTNSSGGRVGAVTNNSGGNFTNNGTTGAVTNGGTFNNNGTTGNVTNQVSGTFNNNSGGTTGTVNNAGTFNNSGTVTTVTNSGTFTNNSGGTTGAFTNSGTLSNAGTIASLTNTGTATNDGAVTGSVTNTSGTFTNNGTTGDWINDDTIVNNGTMGNGTNNNIFTNSGTVGNVTNTATFTNNSGSTGGDFINSGTLSNSGTIASLTSTGTATNDGTISGTVTITSGSLTNSGTTGDWTNAATVTNSGTMGNGTNNGSFTNSGTVGNVASGGDFTNNAGATSGTMSNSGIFTNNGTSGDIVYNNYYIYNNGIMGNVALNYGDITNYSGATIGTITNSSSGNIINYGTAGDWTNDGTVANSGTMGNGTNNNTMTNDGTVGTVANNGTFTNNGTTTAVTNNSGGTFSNFGITTTVNNSGTFTNDAAGTTGDWTNSGTIANSGTMGNGTNSGTYTLNSGSVGNVTNSGTFTFATAGATVGSITNSGTVDITGAGGDVAVAGYTQTSSGLLNMLGTQKFNVSGPVTLDGSLTIGSAPTAFGRYTLITGNSISGTFANVTATPSGSSYLKYGSDSVKLYVTPSSTATQSSIGSVASDIATTNSYVSGRTTGALGNDCVSFSTTKGCVSVGFNYGRSPNGDLASGNMTLSTAATPNVRVGIFLDQAITNPTTGSVIYKSDTPVTGGFIGWNKNADGAGLGVTASFAANSGTYSIARPLVTGAEAGSGTAAVNTSAYQVKAAYTFLPAPGVTVTPYIGMRYSSLDIGGYTESGNVFPLNVNRQSQTATDVIAGISVSKQLTDKLTASAGIGVVQNVAKSVGGVTGSSEINNLGTFSSNTSSSNNASVGAGIGLSYAITPSQRVNVGVNWQQKSLTSADSVGVGVSFSWAF